MFFRELLAHICSVFITLVVVCCSVHNGWDFIPRAVWKLVCCVGPDSHRWALTCEYLFQFYHSNYLKLSTSRQSSSLMAMLWKLGLCSKYETYWIKPEPPHLKGRLEQKHFCLVETNNTTRKRCWHQLISKTLFKQMGTEETNFFSFIWKKNLSLTWLKTSAAQQCRGLACGFHFVLSESLLIGNKSGL